MKANEAPEKIHIQPNAHDRWLEGKIPNGLPNGLFVEYTRTDYAKKRFIVDANRTMSKAKQFIRDYTRNCSNELEGGIYHEWLTPDQARKAVEMAREEVIEKVCEFLDDDLCCYIKAQDFAIEHQRLENDLKQAMNYE